MNYTAVCLLSILFIEMCMFIIALSGKVNEYLEYSQMLILACLNSKISSQIVVDYFLLNGPGVVRQVRKIIR